MHISTYQLINISAYQHIYIRTSTNQHIHISTFTAKLIYTYQHINLSTFTPIPISTNQHINTEKTPLKHVLTHISQHAKFSL